MKCRCCEKDYGLVCSCQLCTKCIKRYGHEKANKIALRKEVIKELEAC